jgi:hypothetical protein
VRETIEAVNRKQVDRLVGSVAGLWGLSRDELASNYTIVLELGERGPVERWTSVSSCRRSPSSSSCSAIGSMRCRRPLERSYSTSWMLPDFDRAARFGWG